jgi:circadian clock protein KaiC
MTAIITGEKGQTSITRYGLEEYVADCVITLDHRVTDQISTRRLRVVKYRGSAHGTNEYPFLISEHGFSVLPITSMRLDHEAPTELLSTGIPELDEMMGGGGVYRGASILISGAPGTGKSSAGVAFVDAACSRGEKALLFAYEESEKQIIRNMRSIGIDLEKWVKKGLLVIHSSRPTLQGLEQHLLAMRDLVETFKPAVLAVDPISNLTIENREEDVKPTLMRLIDFLKQSGITALFTSLTKGGGQNSTPEDSQVGVSSLMDVWLLLRNHEQNGERNRTIYVLKARGMDHSNQVREFVLTDHGIRLVDVYLGENGVLTGSARAYQEALSISNDEARLQEHDKNVRQLASKRKEIEARIAMLQAELEVQNVEMDFTISQKSLQDASSKANSQAIAARRGNKTSPGKSQRKP